tara:strand:+ start:1185 stop:1892 length:708 start_codon:yes stop_codon:yes gene_type:complete
MALPILNDTIKHEITMPSSKKKYTYRPYLVKEEKVLLQAFESNNEKTAMTAMVDTVVACVNEHINPSLLTTYDVEYLFANIRAKSVGETSNLDAKCDGEECDGKTEVTIDVSSAEVLAKKEISNIIKLTEEINIELKHPSYTAFLKNYEDGLSEQEYGMKMIEECVLSVNTEEERITEWTKQEMGVFIDSMTSKQFASVGEYLEHTPKLTKEISWDCIKCGKANKLTLEGLSDFF